MFYALEITIRFILRQLGSVQHTCTEYTSCAKLFLSVVILEKWSPIGACFHIERNYDKM